VESLFVIAVGRRLIHIHNLISGMVKYKIWGSDQVTIVHFDLDKNVETFLMSMIMAHLLLVLILMYYEFLLRTFVHKWWGDVYGGCDVKRLTTFMQPLFVKLICTTRLPIRILMLATYFQILLNVIGCWITTHLGCIMEWCSKT
jgi:hypothetical protein